MLFLTISNGNIFLKTQDTKLGAIVAPDKGLEYNRARNRYHVKEKTYFFWNCVCFLQLLIENSPFLYK